MLVCRLAVALVLCCAVFPLALAFPGEFGKSLQMECACLCKIIMQKANTEGNERTGR